MNALRTLGAFMLLQGLLLFLAVGSLLWNLIAALLYPLLPRRRGLVLGRAAIAYGYRLFWQVSGLCGMLQMDATVLDALREEPRLIVVANHPSLLDALMLVARLPRSACIMKAALMRNPFLGAGARLARYIRNDSALQMVRLAVTDLRAGGQLVIFPEGTRTTKPPINAFRPGVTVIAWRARAPIQTVFIDTDSPYLGKGWPLWRLPPRPIRFTVRLGQRFEPREDAAGLLKDIEAYVAAGVRAPAASSSASALPSSSSSSSSAAGPR